MTPRNDLDSQATGGRASRRRSQRARQASRIVARTRWLAAPLVYWSGQVGELPQFTGGLAPLRAVLQGKLSELQPGLYAVTVGLVGSASSGGLDTAGGPLELKAGTVEPVTHELVAATARAIEAVAKFPRAAAKLVGPIRSWREGALARLDSGRRALAGAESVKAGAPGALALEARAFWLGANLPPSMTLPESTLAAWTTRHADADRSTAQLAAVALGKRRAQSSCEPRLAAWAAAGRALDSWTASSIAWAAAVLGPASLTAIAAATPALNDSLACEWADERWLDRSPAKADELTNLSRLLAAIDAARREPDRRHTVLANLALQSLQLWRGWFAGVPAESQGAVGDAFRRLALDLAYGGVSDLVATVPYLLPDSLPELTVRWIGRELGGLQTLAYVYGLMDGAATTLGESPWVGADEQLRSNLSQDVPPGSVLDTAGAAAIVRAANRLRWMGALDAIATLASWLEACCPVVALGSFWRDVLTVVPAGAVRLDADGARRVAASLETHGRRVAAELALGEGERAATVRALLPVVLTRGPRATGHVFSYNLWLEDGAALDAALAWTDAAEQLRPSGAAGGRIPLPRRAFSVSDPAVRKALLSIGQRVWAAGRLHDSEVEILLGALANGASRSEGAHWSTALPRLVDIAAEVASRVLKSADSAAAAAYDRSDVVREILDACVRWESAGYADTKRLARILADRWRSVEQASGEWDLDNEGHCDVVVRLSEGRIARFLALLQHRPPPREYAWRAVDGWTTVLVHPLAREWLSACLDRSELVGRVVRVLERVALIARLAPGLSSGRLFAPLDETPDRHLALPKWVDLDGKAMLALIARATAVAGVPDSIPGALRRLLGRGSVVQGELVALRSRLADGRALSTAERARLGKLEALAGDPEAFEEDLRAQLRKALPKQLALTGLAAIESLVNRDLEMRWRKVLGGGSGSFATPAWDNALHMLATVAHNRRVLLQLLRHSARGDHNWMHELPPNRAFLDHLGRAGLRPTEWLAERSLVVTRRSGPLRAYATTDPLEVLLMGSLFGTCLSAGKFNAHAAVAAAVEANKRVVFVKDGAGRVLGRQLLAITRDGEIIGFTCYGAGAADPERHGAWVKLPLELLALDHARATGARLMGATHVSAGLSDDEEQALSLFCRGYVDSPEQFDWWIEELGAADPRSGERDRTVLRAMLEEPVPPERDARDCPGWKRDELGWAACRALLWLGADAPRLSREQEEALGLGERQRSLLH